MIFSLANCLILAGVIFAIGAWGVLARRNVLVMLISVELMLNAVNLAFVAFGRAHAGTNAAALHDLDQRLKDKKLLALSPAERQAAVQPLEAARAELLQTGTTGQVFALFIIAIAAAEAAVGLAIILTLFRNRQTVDTGDMRTLQH